MRRFLVGAAMVPLCIALAGAGPTTKPAGPASTRPALTARPAAPRRPVPANWLTVVNKANHFKYRIPPTWKVKSQSEVEAQYEIPGATPTDTTTITVQVAPCDASTAQEDSKQIKEIFEGKLPNSKIVKDQATTLGDKPAWTVVFERFNTTTRTSRRGNQPPQVTEIKSYFHNSMVTAVLGNVHYFVNFVGPHPDKNQATIDQMLGSFEWDEAGANAPKELMAKKPIPADWVTVSNKTNHFEYRMPPSWKTRQQSDSVAMYLIPVGAHGGPTIVVEAQPCHATTTEQDAKELKASILKQTPDAKFVKDEAAMLGDKPAWVLVYDAVTTSKQTFQVPNGPPQAQVFKLHNRYTLVTRVEGTMHYYFTFSGEIQEVNPQLPTIQQVMTTFKWDAPPAKKG